MRTGVTALLAAISDRGAEGERWWRKGSFATTSLRLGFISLLTIQQEQAHPMPLRVSQVLFPACKEKDSLVMN